MKIVPFVTFLVAVMYGAMAMISLYKFFSAPLPESILWFTAFSYAGDQVVNMIERVLP